MLARGSGENWKPEVNQPFADVTLTRATSHTEKKVPLCLLMNALQHLTGGQPAERNCQSCGPRPDCKVRREGRLWS